MTVRKLTGLLAVLLLLSGCAMLRKPETPVDTGQNPIETPAGGQAQAPAGADKSAQVKPIPGYRAPSILARDVLTGEQISLGDLRGKVVMLNFWATWCVPCRDEMPAMEQFQKEAGESVRVVAIGATDTEKPDKMAAFVKELGLTFPVGHDAGEAANRYHVFALPTSYFIDKDGVIRGAHQGPLTLDMMRKMTEETTRAGESGK